MRKTVTITNKQTVTVPHQVGKPSISESPFDRYRGIGSPGIKSGKRAIVKKFRELRGK